MSDWQFSSLSCSKRERERLFRLKSFVGKIHQRTVTNPTSLQLTKRCFGAIEVVSSKEHVDHSITNSVFVLLSMSIASIFNSWTTKKRIRQVLFHSHSLPVATWNISISHTRLNKMPLASHITMRKSLSLSLSLSLSGHGVIRDQTRYSQLEGRPMCFRVNVDCGQFSTDRWLRKYQQRSSAMMVTSWAISFLIAPTICLSCSINGFAERVKSFLIAWMRWR